MEDLCRQQDGETAVLPCKALFGSRYFGGDEFGNSRSLGNSTRANLGVRGINFDGAWEARLKPSYDPNRSRSEERENEIG